MQVRPADTADADGAIDAIRRSIQHLCALDHQNDPATVTTWLASKTPDNMRRWIAEHMVFVAVEGERIVGVASVRSDGHVLLNYVAPEARFQGASKGLIEAIETWASHRGLESLTLDSTATALRFYRSTGWMVTEPTQPAFGVTTKTPMRKAVRAPQT